MTQPSLYVLDDITEFQRSNRSNWTINSKFWLKGQMRHVFDVAQFIGDELALLIGKQRSAREPLTLVDFGCGDGWLLRLVLERGLNIQYVGLDSNPIFISELSKKFGRTNRHRFFEVDLERTIPPELVGVADVGVSAFSLFEFADLYAGFGNLAAILRKQADLLIASIDPLSQIMAVSQDIGQLTANLELYEKYGDQLAYDKDIDALGECEGRKYKGILHSFETYIRAGHQFGFAVCDYKRLTRTSRCVPQIYELLLLERHALFD